MKVFAPYHDSHIIGVLLLLCHLQLSALSQSNTNLNIIIGNNKYEAHQKDNDNRFSTGILENYIGINHSDTDRALLDSSGFNSSATSEPTNFTTSSDDDFDLIPEMDTNQTEEFPYEMNPENSSNNVYPVLTGSIAEHPSSNPSKEPTFLPFSGSIPAESIEEEVTFAIAVTSTINVELVDTSSLMNQGQLELFLEITAGFLSFHLFKEKFMPSLVEKEGIKVDLIRQNRSPIGRSLQQQNVDLIVPLYVSFQVTGMVDEVDTIDSNSANLNFHQLLERILVEKEEDYVEALKFIDDDYFSSLNKANIILDQEIDNNNSIDSSKKEDQELVDLPSEGIPDSPTSDIFPSTESLNEGSSQEANRTIENDEIQGPILSTGAIIGVIFSASALLILIAALIYHVRVRNNERHTSIHDSRDGRDSKNSRRKLSSPHKKKAWNRFSGLNRPVDSVAEQNLLVSQQLQSDKKSYLACNDDLESQAISNPSYNYGSDSISYAYSLEPGIEASVVGSVVTNDRGNSNNRENGGDIPIREIPQVSTTTDEKMGNADRSRLTTQNNEENSNYDHFGSIKIETAPSELKLSKSELEMLPHNLRSNDNERSCDERDNHEFQGHKKSKNPVTRKILAPAGKLGVVIDTTIEGPVVHSVNQGSHLSGTIFPGDIIIAIDEVDTRAMSASAITDVMVKTANQNRTLTVRGPTLMNETI